MIKEHFDSKKMDKILAVMPELMLTYKIVICGKMIRINEMEFRYSRFPNEHFGSLLNPYSLQQVEGMDYLSFPRMEGLHSHLNIASNFGFHSIIQLKTAFDYYSKVAADTPHLIMESNFSDYSKTCKIIWETRILKCGIKKDWIIGIGKEPDGELVVRSKYLLVPQYPSVDIGNTLEKYYSPPISRTSTYDMPQTIEPIYSINFKKTLEEYPEPMDLILQ